MHVDRLLNRLGGLGRLRTPGNPLLKFLLRLALTVALHQLLEFRRFVSRVVIDVKVRTASEMLANDVDEILEHLLLGLTVLTPERTELWSSSIEANDAEEVLEAGARLEMRVAL